MVSVKQCNTTFFHNLLKCHHSKTMFSLGAVENVYILSLGRNLIQTVTITSLSQTQVSQAILPCTLELSH